MSLRSKHVIIGKEGKKSDEYSGREDCERNFVNANGIVMNDLPNDVSENIPLETRQNEKNACMEVPKAAVVVRNAEKSYFTGKKVLAGLNMTIPCGFIYALLGNSGCGKSTLLSCILGIRKLDQGQIYLYGKLQGTESSREIGIPGRSVGYQSQEINLYSEFTITEMLRYFGVLCGMTRAQVDSSTEFIADLLNLPEGSRRLSTLSGGQLRRVSFACALVHNPKLIVLDEPTVGVDSVLRERIWSHLKMLVSSQNVTVLVTTHYLAEARYSQRIGLMRNGVLLAENSPDQLLLCSNASNLEDAVLNLCKAASKNAIIAQDYDNSSLVKVTTELNLPEMASIEVEPRSEFLSSMYRMTALIPANVAAFSRNLLFTGFLVLIPTIFLSIACITVGHTPYEISIAVVNHELGVNGTIEHCSDFIVPPTIWRNSTNSTECDFTMLSCRFLKNVPESSLQYKWFDSEVEAISAVKEGTVWGMISFLGNFSQGFFDRAMTGWNAEDDILDASSITVRLDETNKLVSIAIKVSLLNGLFNFVRDLLSTCGLDPNQVQYPLNFKKPIIGREGLDMLAYASVGIGLGGVLFFPIISAGIRLLHERHSGMLERSLVSGMRLWEFMLAYVISEAIILILQIILKNLVLVYVVGVHNEGNLLLVYAILFLAGCGGISIGLLVGSVCREKIEIAILAITILLPNIILSGLLWPVEAMPEILHDIVNFLPCTLAGESIRSVFNRGWGFTHPNVWPGFLVLFSYFILCNCFTLLYHRFIKK